MTNAATLLERFVDRAGVGLLAAIGAAASLLASVSLASLSGLLLMGLAALAAGLAAFGVLPERKKPSAT